MKKTLLLADDSPTIRHLVTETFDGDDFEVVSVGDGASARRTLEAGRPALVLAEAALPGMTGYEVCAFVKEHPDLEGTPVILLAGAREPFDETEAARVGADGWIAKPFEPSELSDRVRAAVEAASAAEPDSEDDVLGLSAAFGPPDGEPPSASLSPDAVEMIADRVIARLSSEAIESVAWKLVPGIAEKAVREAVRRRDEH